jgi:hypothetical protein
MRLDIGDAAMRESNKACVYSEQRKLLFLFLFAVFLAKDLQQRAGSESADLRTAFAPILQWDAEEREARQGDVAMRESNDEVLNGSHIVENTSAGWVGAVLADETATALQGVPDSCV